MFFYKLNLMESIELLPAFCFAQQKSTTEGESEINDNLYFNCDYFINKNEWFYFCLIKSK